MRMRVRGAGGVSVTALAALLGAVVIGGCATAIKEMRYHPSQERLERLLAAIVPHTKHPDVHYWVRVAEPMDHPIGLASLPQQHIYVSERLIAQADNDILRALVAHGIAHHRLHHHGQRSILNVIQRVAFKAGGFFVPGLSQGHRVGGPLMEVTLSAGQEGKADDKTMEYLTRMGRPGSDWLRVLEFLVQHGYAERVGRITVRDRDFTNRIARLRGQKAGDE